MTEPTPPAVDATEAVAAILRGNDVYTDGQANRLAVEVLATLRSLGWVPVDALAIPDEWEPFVPPERRAAIWVQGKIEDAEHQRAKQVSLAESLREAERERDELRQHILDIDAHATPYGDIPGEPGWVGTYLLTAGALHRALGKIGHSAPSCEAEARLAAYERLVIAARAFLDGDALDALRTALEFLLVDDFANHLLAGLAGLASADLPPDTPPTDTEAVGHDD
jgi:hypothetical protein